MKFTFQQDRVETGPFKKKLTYMASKEVPKAFRICPAFAPPDENGNVHPLSWVPFVDETETATPWLVSYKEWSNIGHGPWGREGNRKSFLRFCDLVPGYSVPGRDYFDPIEMVKDFVRDNRREWGYLFDKGPNPNGREDSVLRWYPDELLLCNVVIYSTTSVPRTTLGSFSQSLRRQLIGGSTKTESEEGIISRMSGLPPDMIAQNPFRRFRLGDVTNPQEGPVLEVYRDLSTGVPRYKIRPAKSENGQGIMLRTLDEQQMADRLDLSNPANFLNFPTDPEGIHAHQQAEIDRLVGCLNQWSPDKKLHEFEMLRYLFGPLGFEIPQPPPVGSVNGFTPPETLQQQPNPEPAQQPAPNPVQPQQTIQFVRPDIDPLMQTPSYPPEPRQVKIPNPMNTTPTVQPPQVHYPAQSAGGYQAPQQPAYRPQPAQQTFPQMQQPAYQPQPQYGQPYQQPSGPSPVQPSFVPQAPAPEPVQAQPQGQPAFIPGAPVAGPQKDSFLSRLMAKNASQTPPVQQ